MVGSTQRLPEELHVPVGSWPLPQGEEELIETAVGHVLEEEAGGATVTGGRRAQ